MSFRNHCHLLLVGEQVSFEVGVHSLRQPWQEVYVSSAAQLEVDSGALTAVVAPPVVVVLMWLESALISDFHCA